MYFRKNTDNIPCEEVCEIIEKYGNKTINLGFKRGFDSKKVYNRVIQLMENVND